MLQMGGNGTDKAGCTAVTFSQPVQTAGRVHKLVKSLVFENRDKYVSISPKEVGV